MYVVRDEDFAPERTRLHPARRAPAPDAGTSRQPAVRVDLLPQFAARCEAYFVRNRNRLALVHAAMFVLFLALMIAPLLLGAPPERAGPFDHFTTFANYAIWGLWFPLVFLSVIFTGRSWCGLMCPMGAASEWANSHGLQRTIPRWLRWEGTPIVSFAVVTILGQTLGVRDHPQAIAEIFGTTMIAAIAVGFVYGRNKRAWCRHACPIGLLLGVFSRIGAVQFAPKRVHTGGARYTEKTVCPTMIQTRCKDESRHCIECFRCVQPGARGGLEMTLRVPGREIEHIGNHNPNPYEVWFLFLGTGLAIGGFLWLVLPVYWQLRQGVAEWFFARDWFWIGEPGPWWLMSIHPDQREVFTWLDFTMIVGFMSASMVLTAAVLASFTAAAAFLARIAGARSGFARRFTTLGYQFAPVAMVSLVVGLGGMLFEPLAALGAGTPAFIKAALLIGALCWSIHLGNRILAGQGVTARKRWLPLAPGALGSLAVAAAWWPAVVG